MSYKSLREAVDELHSIDEAVKIKKQVDPYLEMAEIHRRMQEYGGPAIEYCNVKGSPFTAISNLYGTFERTKFLFRKSLPKLKEITSIRSDPSSVFKKPLNSLKAGWQAFHALPRKKGKLSRFKSTSIDQLPQIVSWPKDGGAFITLPQVYTEPPDKQKIMESNIGMYRIQLSGNEYEDGEIGLHYQLHRGIGVHHKQYRESDKPFKISIFVGGPPSHTFCSIMPLPEGMPEVTMAGLLNTRRFRYQRKDRFVYSTDADFIITGTLIKDLEKPEGPFGDHLGYYSLQHDFPVMKVEEVLHRPDPLWHFTVVGRPPAEDSNFGKLIHEIVKPITKDEFPGLKSLNAVDAAGVHPLLLAVGSERYMPFRQEKPEEILTTAHHLLGKGQTSLAKYLFISNYYDDTSVSAHNIEDFFRHFLERVSWERDLHFMTNTTIDTLDYSGDDWNAGSKVIAAAVGEPKRSLATSLDADINLPKGIKNAQVALPGILCISGMKFIDYDKSNSEIQELKGYLKSQSLNSMPLIVLCDDAQFTAKTLNNFLWVTFTRSNPSKDIYGVNSFYRDKHWGTKGSLIIDARIKPHHAPVLETDEKTKIKVDKLFRKSGPLYKYKPQSS